MKKVCFAAFLVSMVMTSMLSAGEKKPLNMLFVGNSFTGMHGIAFLVKHMVESGKPNLEVSYLLALSGGKTLEWHWGRENQGYLKLPAFSKEALTAAHAEMEKGRPETKGKKGAQIPYNQRANNYEKWLQLMETSRETPKLDYVSLQSHRDEDGELESRYAEYARKYVKLAREHGTKPILYVTAFYEIRPQPLSKAPDPEPIMKKTRYHAKLANELDALVVPMPLAVLKVQQKRPDLTLRYSDDKHLNQACAYLTVCCFYAAIFSESPVGLAMREINNPGFKGRRDPDGNPKNVVFSEEVATVLQKSAWEAVTEMKKLQNELADR